MIENFLAFKFSNILNRTNIKYDPCGILQPKVAESHMVCCCDISQVQFIDKFDGGKASRFCRRL